MRSLGYIKELYYEHKVSKVAKAELLDQAVPEMFRTIETFEKLKRFPVDGWELKSEWRKDKCWWSITDRYANVHEDDIISEGLDLDDVIGAALVYFEKNKQRTIKMPDGKGG